MQSQRTQADQSTPTTLTGSQQPVINKGGVARAIGFVRALTAQAVFLAVVVFILQALMPAGSKPSDVIGSFYGGTDAATLNAERQAQAQTAAVIANAQAQANAKWQMEQQLNQQQIQEQAQALQGQETMANLADLTCAGSGIVAGLFGQDGQQTADAMKSACGAGDALRQSINNSLAQAARNGSGIEQREQQQQLIPTEPYPPANP